LLLPQPALPLSPYTTLFRSELAGTELTLDGSPLPTDPALFDGSQWVHAITPGLSLRLFGFFLSYSMVTLLPLPGPAPEPTPILPDRKSTRLNSSHVKISYAV